MFVNCAKTRRFSRADIYNVSFSLTTTAFRGELLGRRFNRILVINVVAILLLVLWSLGCGNYNYTGLGTNGTVTGGTGSGATGLSERAFVSNLNPNSGVNGIQVVDAGKDLPAI